MSLTTTKKILVAITLLALVVIISAILPVRSQRYTRVAPEYSNPDQSLAVQQDALDNVSDMALSQITEVEPIKRVAANHISPPDSVRAVYMSSWVAGTKHLRKKVVDLIMETDANAIVIDIKDATGKISFLVQDPLLKSVGAETKRISDAREFIAELHDKGIYVIGRLSVFQDPFYALERPSQAVRRASDNELWTDHKGLRWLDASSREVWEYVVALARESYAIGFDEINFDYIRFPSDGNMRDIAYPISQDTPKREVLSSFFAYLDAELRTENIPISADLFGMTTTNRDDLNIGQVLEDALPHFDYIAPMVYPSHYPANFIGIAKPATQPYDVIYYSMTEAGKRLDALGMIRDKLRPWIQDFDLGAQYTSELVHDQIQATYDAGYDSWMSWDPANTYTRAAYLDALPPSELTRLEEE